MSHKFLQGSQRQLTDLRLSPSATDPRPLFLPSAALNPNEVPPYVFTPYPCLRFHPLTRQEIRCQDEAAQQKAEAAGYVRFEDLPKTVKAHPIEALANELGELSDSERAEIIEAQRKHRLQQFQQRLAALSDDELTRTLERAETSAAAKRPAASPAPKVEAKVEPPPPERPYQAPPPPPEPRIITPR